MVTRNAHIVLLMLLILVDRLEVTLVSAMPPALSVFVLTFIEASLRVVAVSVGWARRDETGFIRRFLVLSPTSLAFPRTKMIIWHGLGRKTLRNDVAHFSLVSYYKRSEI